MPKRFGGGFNTDAPIVNNLNSRNGQVFIGNIPVNVPNIPVVANKALAQQTVRARILAGQLGDFVKSLAPGRPPLQ